MKNPMRKPLPLTLLGEMNPCHLRDDRGIMRSDDTTDTLSTYGGSLWYTTTRKTAQTPGTAT
jgi:hypothetical protein